MRRNAWVGCALCVGMLLAVGTQPLLAQRISVAPNIGVYIPTTELVKAASGEQFKQEMSITLGGRVGIFFTERLGLELTGDYAPSDLKVTQSGFADQNQDANVFTGSGRLSYQLIPYTSPIAFIVTGGVGVVNRSGAFYAGMQDKTDIGGTVGASARFRLGSLLRIQINAEDYLYKPKGDIPGFSPGDEKKTQNDVHLSLGIGIPLLGLGQMGK
jgi:outer membrane protein with beta-barrel domain